MSTGAVAILDEARSQLAGCREEALGELVEPRRILGVARAPRIQPRGSAWHLGVLLLTDDAVLSVGEVVRAREEAIRGYTAETQRRRSELAAAARRGGFADGTAVHIGWQVLDADAVDRGAASGPLLVVDGTPSVRWSASGGAVPLEGYLAERIELLRHPPAGA